jgi:hypothetical protein
VIITDERIGHIRERHPDDWERYQEYVREVVEAPQIMIETKKPHTAVILNRVGENGTPTKTILRLHVPVDPDDRKNSIITFMQIDEKTWKRLLENKKVLYKRE